MSSVNDYRLRMIAKAQAAGIAVGDRPTTPHRYRNLGKRVAIRARARMVSGGSISNGKR
jgi:hypothetical protein